MTAVQDTGKFRSNMKDQYYTKPAVAIDCVTRILTVWPSAAAATKWIEPSAGSGAFLEAAAAREITDIIALDISPATDVSGIETADFLSWDPPVGADILVFGNPPFGRQGATAKAFIARAATFATRIAFILPRSFIKPSMSRAFPAEFHCMWSEELPYDSFLVNGESYAVPCVFQLWERRVGIPRALPTVIEPEGYTYVKATVMYDLVIRRVGVRAGAAMVETSGPAPSPQSHYFLLLDDSVRDGVSVEELAAKISAHSFPTNTTGPRSLSKGEINEVVNVILGQLLELGLYAEDV
jgi:hypothetical protein